MKIIFNSINYNTMAGIVSSLWILISEVFGKKFHLPGIGKLYQLQMPINQRVCLYPSKHLQYEKHFYHNRFHLLHHPIEHQEQWRPLMGLEKDGQ
jgi:hypothetical protein